MVDAKMWLTSPLDCPQSPRTLITVPPFVDDVRCKLLSKYCRSNSPDELVLSTQPDTRVKTFYHARPYFLLCGKALQCLPLALGTKKVPGRSRHKNEPHPAPRETEASAKRSRVNSSITEDLELLGLDENQNHKDAENAAPSQEVSRNNEIHEMAIAQDDPDEDVVDVRVTLHEALAPLSLEDLFALRACTGLGTPFGPSSDIMHYGLSREGERCAQHAEY